MIKLIGELYVQYGSLTLLDSFSLEMFIRGSELPTDPSWTFGRARNRDRESAFPSGFGMLPDGRYEFSEAGSLAFFLSDESAGELASSDNWAHAIAIRTEQPPFYKVYGVYEDDDSITQVIISLYELDEEGNVVDPDEDEYDPDRSETPSPAPDSSDAVFQESPATLPELLQAVVRENPLSSNWAAQSQRLLAMGGQDGSLCRSLFGQVRTGSLTERPSVRRLLQQVVASSNDSVKAALAALRDSDDDVRHYAAWVLGGMLAREPERSKSLGVTSAVCDALFDASWFVRILCVRSLGEYAAKQEREQAGDAIAYLSEVLRHVDADVRREAAGALGSCGQTAAAAIPTLNQLKNDADSGVREYARRAIGQIDYQVLSNVFREGTRVKITHELTYPNGTIALARGAEGVVLANRQTKGSLWEECFIVAFKGQDRPQGLFADEMEIVPEQPPERPGTANDAAGK